jgi:phosphinothricin acetyltransferase
MEQLRIRSAGQADLAEIAAIYAPYVTATVVTFETEVPSAEAWNDRFRTVTEAGLPFLVAELDGAVVGYAYCGPWKTRPAYRYTAEDSIYLAPRARGRGLGGRLLDRLITTAGAAGLRELLAVIADTGDPASAALHRSRGFVDAGRLTGVGHKHDRWLDTMILQRSLTVPG